MTNGSTSRTFPMTVGLDLGDRRSRYCLRDASEVVDEGSLSMSRGDLRRGLKRLAKLGAERVVLEVGGQSPWVSRLICEAGLEAVVANPRRVKLITADHRKSDRRDARLLAELGQVRPDLLSPIKHRGEQAQRDLIVLRTRDKLVEGRTALVNEVRLRLKSLGIRLPKCSTESFAKKAEAGIPEELKDTLRGTLTVIAAHTEEIRRLDKKIEELCSGRYSQTTVLRQVKGVGPVTALQYVLTLEQPHRIKKVRNVGAYLGLVPRRHQSGERDPQMRITKAGDPTLRRLLVSCAHYIMGPFGEDCDLRRHGERIAGAGGKPAKKRAIVAVARKLSVLLLSLWRTGEVYEPLRNSKRLEGARS